MKVKRECSRCGAKPTKDNAVRYVNGQGICEKCDPNPTAAPPRRAKPKDETEGGGWFGKP
jgi:hypothetical protein